MKYTPFIWIIILSIITVASSSYASPSFAATPSVQLVINSQKIQTDAPPVNVDGSNMVSLSSLKALGLHLQWDAKGRKVTVQSSGNRNALSVVVGNKVAQFGAQSFPLQTPPILKNNRVLVPVRFISEAFGAEVIWNSADRIVMIRSAEQSPNYKALYQGADLVKARQIAVDLPSADQPIYNSTDEEITYAYHFPEGEALRYYDYEGNHVSYYEIANDVKSLVWEAVVDEKGGYIKEHGKRPVSDSSTVYFRKHRIDNGVDYGRVGDKKSYMGEAANGTLAHIIMKIPNEVRTDQLQSLRQAREAVLSMRTVSLGMELPTIGIQTLIRYFPIGKSNVYFDATDDLITYYKIENNKRYEIWSANYKMDVPAQHKELPFFPYHITKEIGKRPTITTPVAYYVYRGAISDLRYGLIDLQGKETELGHTDPAQTKQYFPVSNEELALLK